MEEMKNFSWEDVVQMSETFPWEPGFSKVVITLNKVEPDGKFILSENTISTEQFIVAKGPHVHNYSVCDTVMLDIEKLMEKSPNQTNQDEMIGRLKFIPIYDDEDNMFALIEDRYILARRKQEQNLQSEV